ncbi:MAG TPA: hypothetical protein EYG57_04425 [Planctomycetes bacterium]|nr:hypothetical protein [Planctomycetota bacterium]
MTRGNRSFRLLIVAVWANCLMAHVGTCWAAVPNPILNTLFPPGGQAGESIEVEISGSGLEGLTALHCRIPGIRIQQHNDNKNRFTISVPKETPLGFYDVRAVCRSGISSPRPFLIGNRPEQLEVETSKTAQSMPLNTTINGRIEKNGDEDYYQFDAKQGERVVVECWAERIDSKLRPMLEILDAKGRQLASNRGYFGTDPLIDFLVPIEGTYVVKLYDLIYSSGAEHYYRLDIDSGPRVAFSFPAVVERGKTARVSLYGWNLTSPFNGLPGTLDRIDVDLPSSLAPTWPLPARLQPAQTVIEVFPYYLPGSHAPVLIGMTDVPVATEATDNHSPKSAQHLIYPCEVSGRLVAGDEQDWFAIEAHRGEVLHFEGFAQRIASPMDLDIRVLDGTANKELLKLADQTKNIGGKTFPSAHLDPVGRWVVPADGRYLVVVRNLIGGRRADPRRVYRLSIRREEPDFSLAVVPRSNDPAGLNVGCGGRSILDVIAFRRRGLVDAIRVSAEDLPRGVECPDAWIGPGVDRTVLVVSAERNAEPLVGELRLRGSTETIERRMARGGVVVRTGQPNGWARLTSHIPLSIAGDAAVRITANGHQTRKHHLYGDLEIRHSPGGILDVAIHVDRRDPGHHPAVKLIGVGLPELIANQTALVPEGEDDGYISFYLPPSLPIGKYSLAVRAETTTLNPDKKVETVTLFSNVVSFDVHPAAFQIDIDPYAPRRIKRGEVVTVNYTARRINGFINKIHTELAMPGKVTRVVGLRGRGATFVGQTDSGTIQIIANEDAPLGQQPFLRLYAVGVLEDEPVFHGSCFLNLEVVN